MFQLLKFEITENSSRVKIKDSFIFASTYTKAEAAFKKQVGMMKCEQHNAKI